jgi:protocatechuate 3,4-dioxygenase, beta subunit
VTAGPTFFTTRRRLLAGTAALAAFRAAPPALAEALAPTPPQTAGPFYPLTLPLDSDNDLVSVRGRPAPAAGEVTHLLGRVLDDRGRPVPGARVEIWQCDAFGAYHHPRDRAGAEGRDPNFQGFGSTVADGEGAYRFRTIRPVPYPGRTPHIHFAIKAPGDEPLVTQMYIRGHPQNEGDFVLGRIRDPKARERVLVDFVPAPAEAVGPGALLAEFDIVLAADGGLSRG